MTLWRSQKLATSTRRGEFVLFICRATLHPVVEGKGGQSMAVIENSVEIGRSPEDVFDYLVDMRNELHGNPDAQSMKKITDGPIGLGTKFLAKWKQSKLVEVECVEFDRPRSWSCHNGGPLELVFRFHCEVPGHESMTGRLIVG
jgi:hypothetical protein